MAVMDLGDTNAMMKVFNIVVISLKYSGSGCGFEMQ